MLAASMPFARKDVREAREDVRDAREDARDACEDVRDAHEDVCEDVREDVCDARKHCTQCSRAQKFQARNIEIKQSFCARRVRASRTKT
jgi:hypothetical protein